MLGDAISQVAHDMVSKGQKSNSKGETTYGLDPDRGACLSAGHTGSPGHVLRREGTDCVGYIVGAVGDGHDHGGADLRSRPEVLHLVVKDRSAAMDVFQTLALVTDDIASESVGGDELDVSKDAAGVRPGQLVNGVEVLLALLVSGDLGSDANIASAGLLGSGLDLIPVVRTLHQARLDCARLLLAILRVRAVTVDIVGGVVVSGDGGIGRTRVVKRVAILPQARAKGNVPEAKAMIFLDELGVEVRDQEDGREDPDAAKDTEHDSASLAGAQLFRSRDAVTTIHDDEEGKDTGSEGIIEGESPQSGLERILARMNQQLDTHHDHGAESRSNAGSNAPRSSDLADAVALPAPCDRELEGNANADEGTD